MPTFDELRNALERTNLGYATTIAETAVANTDYAVLLDDNDQIKLALITDLIGDGDITVGIDGTGYDVQFFGDTTGVYMLWDQSADKLIIRGAAATAGNLNLQTAETSVEDGDKLGQIDFQAPLETGADAILVSASIWAEADATFGATINSTDLVFATGDSELAAEKVRIDSVGVMSFSGTTTPILIAVGTTSAISITGASSTAQINLAHTLANEQDQSILITSSSTSTNGSNSQAPIKMAHTMTGVGAVGGRAEFNTTYNAAGAAGGWTNALKGNFTFGASATGGTGLHSGVCAEITVPDATVSGGFYAPIEAELNLPSSHVPQDKQLTMMYLSANTTPATYDTYGTLFALEGVTGADNKVFDDSVTGVTDPQIEAALRISINGTYWYIPLCDQPDLD